jgi:hypothetical protein
VKKRKCKNKNCSHLFVVSPKHPNQQYCSRKECQRVRKTKWEREKLVYDREYRKNKADSQERWLAKKPWYWKKYREKNPDYTKRNRKKQKERDQSKRALKSNESILKDLAKMDASNPENLMISGIYTLAPVNGDNLAKMDALTDKITEIPKPYS